MFKQHIENKGFFDLKCAFYSPYFKGFLHFYFLCQNQASSFTLKENALKDSQKASLKREAFFTIKMLF